MSGKTSFAIADDRYRILLESTPLVPWEADARTWLFNYVGPQAADLLGYPVEDWYEANFWVDRIHQTTGMPPCRPASGSPAKAPITSSSIA